MSKNYYRCKYCKVLFDSEYKENYGHLKKNKTNFNVICKICIILYNIKKQKREQKKTKEDIDLELFTKGGQIFINNILIEKFKNVVILKNVLPNTRIYIKCLNCDKDLKSYRNQLYSHVHTHIKRKIHTISNSSL